MKKIHLCTKRLFQIFLYLFETLGIAILLTFISDIFIPSNNYSILYTIPNNNL